MFFYLILYFLGFIVFCFTLFLLSYYELCSFSAHRKCQHLPQPAVHFIFGVALDLIKYPADEILDFMANLWRKTGNVFYLSLMGVPVVTLINPEDIEVLFSNIKYVRKGEEYRLLRPWLGDGLLTSTGERWLARRKQLTASFHFKILETYLPIFNNNAKSLTGLLAKTRGKPVSIHSSISSCTLDIICETTMGTSLDLLRKDAREYATSLKEILSITYTRLLTFWWHSAWVFYFSPIGRRYYRHLKRVNRFVDHIIEERRQMYYTKKDVGVEENILARNQDGLYKRRESFLDHLLSIQKKDPASLSDSDIRDEVNTFMFEGHDTVAAAITWTLFLLANHPEVQDRARDELNQVFPSSDVYDISTEDLSKLQYLEMVMKESLRLYPSVPYLTRRIPHDLKIVTGGYVIPAGVNVIVMPYLVHRNPAVFEDPEKFYPERFMPEMAKTYHPCAYLPFSAGYRNCIGQRFAMVEVKIVLADILKKFRISSTQKREDIKLFPAVVIHPSPEIMLSFDPVTSSTPPVQ